MIVRMKEILLFTTARTVDDTILQLGRIGSDGYRKNRHRPANGTLERRGSLATDEMALSLLKAHLDKSKKISDTIQYSANDPKQLVDRLLLSETIREKCKKRSHRVK